MAQAAGGESLMGQSLPLGAPQIKAQVADFYMGVSENRGSYYNTLNSRILIIRTPK